MKFFVIPNKMRVPSDGNDVAYLWTDNWNDWFEFNTLYHLTYFDNSGNEHNIGGVKIGQFNWIDDQRRPDIPEEFEQLDTRFFSLGQDAEYYEKLTHSDSGDAAQILDALNDVVKNEGLYFRAKNEKVMGVSLMRHVNERTITDQYRRIILGGVRLTSYAFRYVGPKQMNENYDPVELTFSVEPNSKPPTNVHAIVGRNGVGKSFLLNAMSRALVYPDEDGESNGRFFDDSDALEETYESPFGNIVSVTFSAFDDFPIIRTKRNALKGIQYTNIGLRKQQKETNENGAIELNTITRDPNDLAEDFISSVKICTRAARKERWIKALQALETDPIFEEAAVTGLLEHDLPRMGQYAGKLFRRLSSGHKIVLLTVTKLVEKVDERTLVLIDEPEAHLHPPLLAALIRGLSNLLIDRNGVAIIATHSPVVLQEVPNTCVWKIRRHGGVAVAERVPIETFAEHVGHLTYEVFGLEVTRSGFHSMIAQALEEDDDYFTLVDKFDKKIGSEGRALISTLVVQRDGGSVEDID